LVAVFAFTSGSVPESEISRNYSRALDLLGRGRLDPKTLELDAAKKIFRGKVLNPQAGEPRMVEVRFVTEEEINRYRREGLEVYNWSAEGSASANWTPADWKVKEPFAWQYIVQPLLWVLVIVLLYYLFLRQLRAPGPGGNILTFGRSRVKVANRESTGVTFDDVAGIDEAKQEVREIVEFLRDPKRLQKLGGRIPRGVMLVGSPGTGKTLLAKAIAGEAEVPFYSICGSDFVEMFVGVGASRVRDLFRQARENSPCIVFLDEVDAVGRRRGTGLGGGHDEREQTLNAILVEMDGFESDTGVIMIAATNRPDVLDPALLRPGRFDREITIDLPDLKGREQILAVHTQRVRLDAGVDLSRIARATPGFSGAEIAALVNEAAIVAAMKEREAVVTEDLEEARDKIRWGRQKKNKVLDDSDRRVIAYHEAGHAIVAHLLPDSEPVHKVTIIPRGYSLGSTMQLPEKDRYHVSRKEVTAEIMILYAGRVAEELFCDDVTAGAKSDIERATELTRLMVCEWGMSENLGPINYSESQETLFLGREVTRSRNHSEHLAEAIDREVRRIIDECYASTKKLIHKHRDAIVRLADALLERETLSGEDVAAVVDGRPLPHG
jgi:cell division protease FtsH